MEDKHSVQAEMNDEQAMQFDEHEFLPHFQRVSISGDSSGVPLEDLERAGHLLIKALELRERYMSLSHQSFNQTAGRFVRARQQKDDNIYDHGDRKTIEGRYLDYSPSLIKFQTAENVY